MKLTPVMEKFILHWGEMGTKWGVNRSVSQIHALLYLSESPLPADEIAKTLGIARSNVSGSLKELLAWDLIKTKSILGDRRDHFEAKGDLWEMLTTVVEGLLTREIKPTIETLEECVREGEKDKQTPKEIKERIARMRDFIATLDDWYEDVKKLPKPTLIKLMNMGSKVARFLKG